MYIILEQVGRDELSTVEGGCAPPARLMHTLPFPWMAWMDRLAREEMIKTGRRGGIIDKRDSLYALTSNFQEPGISGTLRLAPTEPSVQP